MVQKYQLKICDLNEPDNVDGKFCCYHTPPRLFGLFAGIFFFCINIMSVAPLSISSFGTLFFFLLTLFFKIFDSHNFWRGGLGCTGT